MSSAGRSPAQRNTNVTAVVPVRNGSRYYVSVEPRHIDRTCGVDTFKLRLIIISTQK